MDITKEHLKQIIEEELLEMMNEDRELFMQRGDSPGRDGGGSSAAMKRFYRRWDPRSGPRPRYAPGRVTPYKDWRVPYSGPEREKRNITLAKARRKKDPRNNPISNLGDVLGRAAGKLTPAGRAKAERERQMDNRRDNPYRPDQKDGEQPIRHDQSHSLKGLKPFGPGARTPAKEGDVLVARGAGVGSYETRKVGRAEAAWRKRQRDRLADRGPTGARLRRAQEKALAKESQNDITKADLKRVIREELEAFLDDHYSK